MCARARWVERGVTITEKVKKHRWGSRYKFIDHPIYYIDYPINCIDYPTNFLQSEHIIKNGGVYWTRCNIKHKFPKLVYLLKVRKTSDQIEINCAHFENCLRPMAESISRSAKKLLTVHISVGPTVFWLNTNKNTMLR